MLHLRWGRGLIRLRCAMMTRLFVVFRGDRICSPCAPVCSSAVAVVVFLDAYGEAVVYVQLPDKTRPRHKVEVASAACVDPFVVEQTRPPSDLNLRLSLLQPASVRHPLEGESVGAGNGSTHDACATRGNVSRFKGPRQGRRRLLFLTQTKCCTLMCHLCIRSFVPTKTRIRVFFASPRGATDGGWRVLLAATHTAVVWPRQICRPHARRHANDTALWAVATLA